MKFIKSSFSILLAVFSVWTVQPALAASFRITELITPTFVGENNTIFLSGELEPTDLDNVPESLDANDPLQKINPFHMFVTAFNRLGGIEMSRARVGPTVPRPSMISETKKFSFKTQHLPQFFKAIRLAQSVSSIEIEYTLWTRFLKKLRYETRHAGKLEGLKNTIDREYFLTPTPLRQILKPSEVVKVANADILTYFTKLSEHIAQQKNLDAQPRTHASRMLGSTRSPIELRFGLTTLLNSKYTLETLEKVSALLPNRFYSDTSGYSIKSILKEESHPYDSSHFNLAHEQVFRRLSFFPALMPILTSRLKKIRLTFETSDEFLRLAASQVEKIDAWVDLNRTKEMTRKLTYILARSRELDLIHLQNHHSRNILGPAEIEEIFNIYVLMTKSPMFLVAMRVSPEGLKKARDIFWYHPEKMPYVLFLQNSTEWHKIQTKVKDGYWGYCSIM